MDIYIYSDESGVFDKEHNNLFVFGGIVFLDKKSKDDCTRMYAKAEKDVRFAECMEPLAEAKACRISNKSKYKLFRSLNNRLKFGVVIYQKEIHSNIYTSKKDKQRYLDYAYKIAVKRLFEKLIKDNEINPKEVRNLYFFIDQHSTATNGCYELKEALEQEFKRGTYNNNWQIFYPPIFESLIGVSVKFCDSEQHTLIRAADIIANRIYYLFNKNLGKTGYKDNLHIIKLP